MARITSEEEVGFLNATRGRLATIVARELARVFLPSRAPARLKRWLWVTMNEDQLADPTTRGEAMAATLRAADSGGFPA